MIVAQSINNQNGMSCQTQLSTISSPGRTDSILVLPVIKQTSQVFVENQNTTRIDRHSDNVRRNPTEAIAIEEGKETNDAVA